ncbi:putative metalloprotease CJM1_0395 family protein [Oceanicoccus sagamiensis]|uniref:Catalase n=1 Tax=Oceanicoccus sagamiensis TaxID=716816 RepID=A0A1X9N837_9GAMM|nr:putative metalloprotease CJM1_0395 family protein [Oceanicoccus sagamiensis]ARN74230.1 hypothetical protein BST96_08915 [Oceanicoccus sagamiensis]
MVNVGINTSAFANVVTPFSPVGKQAVGLENAEAKEEVFSPVEEPAVVAAAFDDAETEASDETSQNRDDDKITDRREQQEQQQEQQQIRELAARDREVRAHEQAHASVGGKYAGSPSYTFERGPDGVNYAVGGEVPISLPSGGEDPQATLAAAEQVRRAALAPAEPSSQDRSIAATASQIANDARVEIAVEAREEQVASEESGDAAADDSDTVAAREAEQEKQAAEEARSEEQARQERLEELRAVARRSLQLSERLITLDNIQSQQSVGSVVDQLA